MRIVIILRQIATTPVVMLSEKFHQHEFYNWASQKMLRRDVDRPRCLCYPHCIKPSPQTEKKCWDWVKKGLWEFLRSLVTARKPAIWLHAIFVFLWSHGLEIFQLALGAFLAWSIIRGYRALKCYLRVENTVTGQGETQAP